LFLWLIAFSILLTDFFVVVAQDILQSKHGLIIAANKFDLLPEGVGPNRVQHWLKQEFQKIGLVSTCNVMWCGMVVWCGVVYLLAIANHEGSTCHPLN
jgi:hypothetical protein